MTKTSPRLLSLAIFGVFCGTTGRADPIVWTLAGVTLSDGSSLTGSFVLDVDAPVPSRGLTQYEIVVHGGNVLPGFTYEPSNPFSSLQFYKFTGTNGQLTERLNAFRGNPPNGTALELLYLDPVTFLTDAGGVVPLDLANSTGQLSNGEVSYATVHVVTGSLIGAPATVPEPGGQPMPVSVTPSSTSFNYVATIPYTFVASDSNGAGDLQGMDVLFGSPDGEPYTCWLFYNHSTNQISVWNSEKSITGPWITEPAGQPGAILRGNGCAIDSSTVSASASGNNLSVSMTITLRGLATNSIYMSALNMAGVGSPYIRLGDWTATRPAFQMTVSPAEGYIPAGGSLTTMVTVTPDPGFHETVNLSLTDFPQGSNLSGSFNPSSITGGGSSILTITSTAQSPASMDPVEILPNGSLQMAQKFTTMIDIGPPAIQVNLGSGPSGAGASFGVDVKDGATAETIQGYNLLFNTTLNGENACWVWYDARTNYIWLASDDESTWKGVVLNGPVTTSNSQCTVGSFGSSAQNPGTNGTKLSSTITISFAPGFAGTKNIYARASNFAGFDSGYQLQGSYTIQ
ncbi:MAG TPA: hypothetical protein VGM43_11765 [Bryobacteraceae bacterium]|jgi:hypothetical protein